MMIPYLWHEPIENSSSCALNQSQNSAVSIYNFFLVYVVFAVLPIVVICVSNTVFVTFLWKFRRRSKNVSKELAVKVECSTGFELEPFTRTVSDYQQIEEAKLRIETQFEGAEFADLGWDVYCGPDEESSKVQNDDGILVNYDSTVFQVGVASKNEEVLGVTEQKVDAIVNCRTNSSQPGQSEYVLASGELDGTSQESSKPSDNQMVLVDLKEPQNYGNLHSTGAETTNGPLMTTGGKKTFPSDERTIIVMLMATSLSFVLFTAFVGYLCYIGLGLPATEQYQSLRETLFALYTIPFILNKCLNFLFYYVTSANFRKTFKLLFLRCPF